MPAGGHRQQWYGGERFKRLSQIFRPGWDKFYKRAPNRQFAKKATVNFPVASLWSLQMKGCIPTTQKYSINAERYLTPARQIADRTKLAYIMRSLEASGMLPNPKRKVATSSLIRNATTMLPSKSDSGDLISDVQISLLSTNNAEKAVIMNSSLDGNGSVCDGDDTILQHPFVQTVGDAENTILPYVIPASAAGQDTFLLHRLQRLCAQHDLYWEDKSAAVADGKAPENQLPYIDEQASVLQTLPLRDILFSTTKHRTHSRKSPRWEEVERRHSTWTNVWRHKNRMNKIEAAEKLGVLKQADLDAQKGK